MIIINFLSCALVFYACTDYPGDMKDTVIHFILHSPKSSGHPLSRNPHVT